MYDLTSQQYDYPRWQGKPARTIVVCTHPRSGSTLLGEALYFAGELGCPLEYLHVGLRPRLQQEWQLPELDAYVQALHERRTAPSGTFSMKLFWREVEEIANELEPDVFGPFGSLAPETTSAATYRELYRLFAPMLPNPVFIHLERADVLRHAISCHFATESGRWRHIPGVEDRAALREAAFDYDRIASLAGVSRYAHTHWRQFFAANGIEPLHVAYEALDSDYTGTVQSVLRYLGSAADVPPVRMQRQSDGQSEMFAVRFLREHKARESAGGDRSAQR
jgi:LPS sulfotransferase NodH